jgi:hypothetical protein
VNAFECVPLTCRLTVSSCVARRRAAGAERGPTSHHVTSPGCLTCEVGAAHAREELPATWPDGRPVVRLAIAPAIPTTPAPKTDEDDMTKTYTHDGITDTVAGWAKRSGVTPAALRMRLRTRSIGEAIAMGKNPPTGGAARKARLERSAPAPSPKRPAKPRSVHRDPKPENVAGPPALDAVEVLRRLGWDAEQIAATPAGRLVLVRGAV